MATAYVYDPVYLAHNQPSHPENARRLQHILATLEEEGLLSRLTLLSPRSATDKELERVHTPELIDRVRRASQPGGGNLDPDTYASPGSFKAARMAAGGVVRAVEATLAGEIANGFALVRPPGHHATATRAMGFCLFNNVAVAARAALTTDQVERVLIVDFDVHHGNGTQEAFARDPAVLYISMHQYPHYPGTGHWREMGQGPGKGSVLNIPLPPGVGDKGYARIFGEIIQPGAHRFQPDLVLVSAGYDAHWRDPLAQMNLSLTGYARLAQCLVATARELCGGRIVFVLEGGYDLDVLAHGVLNTFYALLVEDRIHDPVGPSPHTGPAVDELLSCLKKAHGLN